MRVRFLNRDLGAGLFPTRHSDLAFHVPPYWVPLDPGALVEKFASDLALRNRLVDAVLALPDGSKVL